MVSFDGATSYLRYFEDPVYRKVATAGYPLAVEFFKILFDPVIAGQLVSAVFASLMVFPLWELAKKYVKEEWRIWAVVAVVFNPLIFRYGMITMSDAMGLSLFVFALYFLDEEAWVLSSVSLFLAWLTRPELGVALPFFAWYARKELFKFFIPFGVLLALNTAIVSWDLGHFALSNKQGVLPSISNYPSNFVGHAGDLLKYGGGFVIVGAVALWQKRNTLWISLLVLFVLPLYDMLLMHGRYVIVPLFGLVFLSFTHKKMNSTLLVFLFLTYSYTLEETFLPDEDMMHLKDAGLTFQAHGEKVFDRKPYTAYYSGGEYVEMPNKPLADMFAYAESSGVKYFVVSDVVVSAFRPQLAKIVPYDTLRAKSLWVKMIDGERVKVWKKE
jgi:hypothetical protein